MTYEGLPFLIRNGAWLWIPTGAMALVWWIVRPYWRVWRLTKRWWRHTVPNPVSTTANLRDGAPAVLAGRIRAEGAAIAAETVWAHTVHDLRHEEIATHASIGARLELVDGTMVALAGPVRVIAGS